MKYKLRGKTVVCAAVLSLLFLPECVELLESAGTGRKLVRIELKAPDQYAALSDMHLDLASLGLQDGAHVIATPEELREIERRGFSYEILVDDPSSIVIDPEFRDYEETMAFIDSLAAEYPGLTRTETIGASQEMGIPIRAMKISDNPNVEEDEVEILFHGVTHAREPLGNEICLGIAVTLLEGYGTDPDITEWVESEEIWIVPILNTEGFTYMMDNDLSDPWWRKNQRDNNGSGDFEEEFDGVDLNRNYDFNWISGGSSDPSSWVYRGPDAFSESETSAIRDLVLIGGHRFMFGISYHSYGQEVLYPWAWSGHPPPDLDVITDVAFEVASRIVQRDGTGTYDYPPIEGTVGYSTNWLYGGAGTIDFTIETCTEFIPAGTAIDSIVGANIPGALYLLGRSLDGPGITGHVTESGTGDPIEAEVIVLERDNEDITSRTSDPHHGRYYRLLPPGVYAVSFGKDGYETVIEAITVDEEGFTTFDVELSMAVDVDLSSTSFDDDGIGGSSGNGDGIPNPGETVELTAWLENVGILTAYSVSCSLSTQSSLVTVSGNTSSYGDIEPDEILGGDTPFVFTVSGDAEDGDAFSLTLTAVDTASNSWTWELDYTVDATDVDLMSRAIDDSEGGNGNGVPEPGETFDLVTVLKNYGSLDAANVWAELSTESEYIDILVDSAFFGDIAAGRNAIGSPYYTLEVSPDVADSHTVTLIMHIHGDGYDNSTQLEIHLGAVSIDGPDESSPFPRVTTLHQNYPNPFNPSTMITFDIAGEEGADVPVRLAVYSLRGRLVRELVKGSVEPGSHTTGWDGNDLNGTQVGSGVYLLVLETPGSTSSLKMVIRK